jgi:hypothetical protein
MDFLKDLFDFLKSQKKKVVVNSNNASTFSAGFINNIC